MGSNLARLLFLLLVTTAFDFSGGSLVSQGHQVSRALPKVVTIAVPTYPTFVRLARIEGAVHLKITTDGQQIADVKVQDGPQVLAALSEKNVRTWQLSPHDPTTFTVTYVYKLVKSNTSDTSVTLNLPLDVEISAIRQDYVDTTPDK
jgi:hypothetical protein